MDPKSALEADRYQGIQGMIQEQALDAALAGVKIDMETLVEAVVRKMRGRVFLDQPVIHSERGGAPYLVLILSRVLQKQVYWLLFPAYVHLFYGAKPPRKRRLFAAPPSSLPGRWFISTVSPLSRACPLGSRRSRLVIVKTIQDSTLYR